MQIYVMCYYFYWELCWHNYCKMLNKIIMISLMSPGRTEHVCNLLWRSIISKLEKSPINIFYIYMKWYCQKNVEYVLMIYLCRPEIYYRCSICNLYSVKVHKSLLLFEFVRKSNSSFEFVSYIFAAIISILPKQEIDTESSAIGKVQAGICLVLHARNFSP